MSRTYSGLVQRFLLATMLVCALASLSAQKLTLQGEAHVNWEYARKRVPLWSQGFLIPIVNNGMAEPVIHFIDDTGTEGAALPFSIPGARSVMIDDVA